MDTISFLFNITPVALVFLIVGLCLVIFEMFHPGLSAPGILGCILLILGVIVTAKSFLEGMILVIMILAVLGIALSIVVHSVTKGHLSRVLILSETSKKESDSTKFDDMQYFVGKEGKTLTTLRPSGMADFDGVRLDVITEGDFIEKDRSVNVIRIDGKKIIVKENKSNL
jgi:membrane-bound ClpP family serine protease